MALVYKVLVSCLALLTMRVGAQLVYEATTRGQMFSDERAGDKIDYLSDLGKDIIFTWQERFDRELAEIDTALDELEDIVDEMSDENRFNVTNYAMGHTATLDSTLSDVTSAVDALNATDEGDDVSFFFKANTYIVTYGDAYDANSGVAGGTFTVQEEGLYQIHVRTMYANSNLLLTVTLNGTDTLLTVDHNNYYDVRTRIKLIHLSPGDNIYLTGTIPSYWGVYKLRTQTLLPDTL